GSTCLPLVHSADDTSTGLEKILATAGRKFERTDRFAGDLLPVLVRIAVHPILRPGEPLSSKNTVHEVKILLHVLRRAGVLARLLIQGQFTLRAQQTIHTAY